MAFDPFEVSIAHIVYACLGGFIVLFGMFSLFLREKLYVGEACWAFIFGVIIGPYGANIFNPRGWSGGNEDVTNDITLEFTRVVLAIGVFGIGVELPKAYMRKHWKSLFYLLVPIMTWGWFVSAGFIYALVPGLNFLSSLVVAACLTPTDPILAQAVVGGKYADKHVPAHLRHLLAAESGCNDGAAFPFLYIGLYLIIYHQKAGPAVRDWFLVLWLYQVILGIVIGAVVGIGFRYLMKYCERHDLIDRHSYVAQYVSLALFTVGVTVLLGSDDLLSTFACGTAFAWDGFFNRQTEESVFSSVMDLLFNIACFVYLGAWMPFNQFTDEALTLSVWRLVVIAILVLLFRRLPAVIALYKWIPDIKTFREAVFSGHFGPIGVGAVFISTLAAEVLHEKGDHEDHQVELLTESIQPIVAFMVLCSILIHGLSIPSFSLGRRVHSVTRTWSRHTTIGGGQGAPDWTNQATIVTDPDQIVVNRDMHDAAERGEVVEEEKERRSEGSGSLNEKEKRASRSPVDEEGQVHHPPEVGETLPPGETPPDGEEIVSEWQEGPHRVIERRKGPGEEVEVEVIRNYGSSEAQSSMFRGNHATAHDHMNTYMAKLKKLVEMEEKGVKEKKRSLEADVVHLEKKAKETVQEIASPESSHHRLSIGSSSSKSKQKEDNSQPTVVLNDESAVADDDEDEGWADDDDPSPDSSSGMIPRSESRSKSPKMASGSGAAGGSSKKPKTGRRRGSMRKGLGLGMLGGGKRHAARGDDDDEERRGRSEAPVRPSTGNPNIRNLRLDTVRTQHSRTRESSPARSVRWMDEETLSPPMSPRSVSGTSTPTLRHHHSNSLTLPHSAVFHYGSPVSGSRPSTPPPPPAQDERGQ
ncbi:hypothetical protein V5O48_005420 [Marasmius crinis-equi]|uniref:Cation/H+ exchanger transmembrane domain-containing protein n=1 Tax=Marasmius crinis-equi TaxID=585013 RepID=A0ABR3FMD3_9AGAR